MQRLIGLLATCAAVACAASAGSRSSDRPEPDASVVDSVQRGHAAVDLTGSWATGTAGEPAAGRIVLRPECNFSPAHWIIQQTGDTVRLWAVPAIRAQGTPSRQVVSTTPAMGRVSGVDLRISAVARYALRYDSTSGHLRGTSNAAPFWAARQDIVRPQGCIPPP
jgi:hypothetical protein